MHAIGKDEDRDMDQQEIVDMLNRRAGERMVWELTQAYSGPERRSVRRGPGHGQGAWEFDMDPVLLDSVVELIP